MNQEFPKTLLEAVRYFSDPDVTLQFVAEMRWPDGRICPNCGGKDHSFLATRRIWKCKSCKRQFSVKQGTIFEDSPIGLDKWLLAIWLIVNAKNGVSSYEIHRAIGVTQKTAWFMGHRIRLALQVGSFDSKIGGEVEVDETFIGGKARNMHKGARKAKGRGAAGKSIVMGLLERHGEVRVKVVENTKRKTLQPIIREHVEPGSEVFTDALASYDGLSPEFVHGVIDHAECYAKGKIHTNGLENFWSLTKRAIKGTYVSIEPFHLFRYMDEEAYRFNSRKDRDYTRFQDAVESIKGKRLRYKTLIGESVAQA